MDINKEKKKELEHLNYINAVLKYLIDNPNAIDYKEKYDSLKEYFIKEGMVNKAFHDTQDNKLYKCDLIKACIIYDDLSFFDKQLKKEPIGAEGFCNHLQSTKNIMLPLANLNDNMHHYGIYIAQSPTLIELNKKISPGLDFAKHLRNKIVGHLENEVYNNAIQWEPSIFKKGIKDVEHGQRMFVYRSILESAINSYVKPSTDSQKIFNHEIDLFYPKDIDEFYNYLENLVTDSLRYLDSIMKIIDSKIVYHNGIPLDIITAASETNFRVKPKGR